MKRLLQLFFLPIIMSSGVFAGDDYANINKSLFVLPDQLSMAGANLSFGRDGAPMSNPANLPLDSISELSLSYGGFWDNTFGISVISYATSLSENDGVGVSLGYLHVPDILITTGLDTTDDKRVKWDESKISYGSASELYLTFGYGKNFHLRPDVALSAGFALHALRRRLLDEPGKGIQTGYGIGADIGATLHFLRKGLRLSVLADDITTNYIYWDDEYNDQTLPHLRLGVGWQKDLPYIHGRFTVVYQSPDLLQNEGVRVLHDEQLDKVELTEDGDYREILPTLFTGGRYGLEYVIRQIVAIRVGYHSGQVSFGMGLNLFDDSFGLDCGYLGSELPGTYILSLSYRMK